MQERNKISMSTLARRLIEQLDSGALKARQFSR
jgi:hypothetical protein